MLQPGRGGREKKSQYIPRGSRRQAGRIAGMSNTQYTRSCTYEISRRKPAGPLLGASWGADADMCRQPRIAQIRSARGSTEKSSMAPLPRVWRSKRIPLAGGEDEQEGGGLGSM